MVNPLATDPVDEGIRNMYDPLGLSIGTMNLVAATTGSAPVIRRAVLTLYPHCAPKIVAPEEKSGGITELGTPMGGFVERVGDSVALVSPDGSAHDPDLLTVEALDNMIAAAGADSASSEIAIAVPAHWKAPTVQALRNALRTHVGFVRSGMAPRLVPDAIAALTAVRSETEVPSTGVVAILDFGASGTQITLVEIKDEIEPVGATMRYEEFSGNQIDQAVLLHVIETLDGEDADPAGTAAVGQVGRLRAQCQEAKERLSTDAVTELAAELSDASISMELTRDKFEDLIQDRLTGLIYAFDDMLARTNSCFADLAALVTVGGGASIPLVAQRLSVHTRLPILTTAEPMCAAAQGALLLAGSGNLLDLRTRTSIGLMAGVAGAAGETNLSDRPGGDVLVIDHDALTDRELAWSQTEFPEVPTRFTGDSYNEDGACFSMRLNVMDPPKEPPWRRFRVSQVLIGLCAAVAMTAIGGVTITLTAIEQRHAPHKAPIVPSVAPTPPSASAKPASPAPASPVSPVEPSPLPPPTEVPAPSVAAPPPSVETPVPPPPPPPPQAPSMTTTRPAPVTTTRPPAATSPVTTTPPSPSPSQWTGAAEAPSAAEAPTEPPSSVKMTTQWLHVPLIPVPIPIQVPANGAPQSQAPQYQVPQDSGPQNPFSSPGSP